MRPFDARTRSGRESGALSGLDRLIGVDEPALDAGLDGLVPPVPLKIQVQTATRCNAACAMCPYPEVAGAPDFTHGQMSDALYDRLLTQLAGRPVERFSPFLMNEPLLDKRLESLVGRARTALPGTTLGLFTNGSALTPARAEALAGAGLDELCVSVHGFDPTTYGEVMAGLSLERVLDHLRAIVGLHRAGTLGGLTLQIITGDTPALSHSAAAAPDWLAPYVVLKGFSNERVVSGSPSASADASRTPDGARPLCQRPFVKLYVLSDGDCVMCNCDWRRRVNLGNIGRTDLDTIWQGAAYRALRRLHVRRAFEAAHPCHGCDYPWVVDE
ncbi:SPASM domain-containing protein [Myxococcota bacterium]|nr:SPASM domain-containing protein [Myxococcota bacterium]